MSRPLVEQHDAAVTRNAVELWTGQTLGRHPLVRLRTHIEHVVARVKTGVPDFVLAP